MFKLYQEGDKVVLDFGRKVRDVLLTCGQAEVLENELQTKADLAELAEPELVKGIIWDVKVESYDGKVAIRIIPPFSYSAGTVPIPFADARKLADIIRFKRQQAAYKMRFEVERPGRASQNLADLQFKRWLAEMNQEN